MRGPRLRAARPEQEHVLGAPPALASGRQAGPGRVHGVHQPGVVRAPAAARLRGARLQLLPVRARAVPDAPPAMAPGRAPRHQCLAAGPGLRGPVTAAGHLPGLVLRAVGDADLGVLLDSSQKLAARRPAGGQRVRRRARRSRSRVRVDRRALPSRPAAAGDPVRAPVPRRRAPGAAAPCQGAADPAGPGRHGSRLAAGPDGRRMGRVRAARHQGRRRAPVRPGRPCPHRAAGLRQRLGRGVPP